MVGPVWNSWGPNSLVELKLSEIFENDSNRVFSGSSFGALKVWIVLKTEKKACEPPEIQSPLNIDIWSVKCEVALFWSSWFLSTQPARVASKGKGRSHFKHPQIKFPLIHMAAWVWSICGMFIAMALAAANSNRLVWQQPGTRWFLSCCILFKEHDNLFRRVAHQKSACVNQVSTSSASVSFPRFFDIIILELSFLMTHDTFFKFRRLNQCYLLFNGFIWSPPWSFVIWRYPWDICPIFLVHKMSWGTRGTRDPEPSLKQEFLTFMCYHCYHCFLLESCMANLGKGSLFCRLK